MAFADLDIIVGSSISNVWFQQIVPEQDLVYFLIQGLQEDITLVTPKIPSYEKVLDGYVGEGTYYQSGVVEKRHLVEAQRALFSPPRFRASPESYTKRVIPQEGFLVQGKESLPDDVLRTAYEELRRYGSYGMLVFEEGRANNMSSELRALFTSIASATLNPETRSKVPLVDRLRELNP